MYRIGLALVIVLVVAAVAEAQYYVPAAAYPFGYQMAQQRQRAYQYQQQMAYQRQVAYQNWATQNPDLALAHQRMLLEAQWRAQQAEAAAQATYQMQDIANELRTMNANRRWNRW